MSLLDSLLVLDAPRLDAWIAVRTDGVKGSGTETDPYDGSSKPYPAVSVTSLTRIGTEDGDHLGRGGDEKAANFLA